MASVVLIFIHLMTMMTKSVMQQAIDAEFGTFDEDVHESFLIDEEEIRRSMILLSSSRVYSYDTSGGIMFDWVLEPDFEEE